MQHTARWHLWARVLPAVADVLYVCGNGAAVRVPVVFGCVDDQEELQVGEYWEEVELDEFGNPIEATARAGTIPMACYLCRSCSKHGA